VSFWRGYGAKSIGFFGAEIAGRCITTISNNVMPMLERIAADSIDETVILRI
jgi:hypothetical protein